MFLAVLGTVVFLSSTAYASFWGGKCKGKECPMMADKEHCQCPIADKFMMKAHFLLENKSEVGLTDDQVTTIKGLKLQMEKDSIRQSADMKTFELDLKSKLSEDKVDVDGTNALIDQNFTSASAAAKSNLATYAKLKSLLSPDQITKMKALYEQKEKKEKTEEKDK
jgi:hypothetical protein